MPKIYIDANYLLKELSFYADRPTKSAMQTIKGLALKPNPDVVEVVRCKDCLEAKEVRPGRYSCFSFAGTNDGNWYCGDGKRKETKDE